MHRLLLLFLLFSGLFKAPAQSPAALYVHLDREYYAVGDDVWFKVYALNRDSVKSKVLYVDWVDWNGEVRSSHKLLLENKSAAGDFRIPPDWEEGLYTFRAYTNWALNFGHDFIFSKKIPVYQLPDSLPSKLPAAAGLPDGAPLPTANSSPTGLRIQIQTNRWNYHRGDTVLIELTVSDTLGQPVAAELSLSVRDLQLTPPKSPADLIFRKKEKLDFLLKNTPPPSRMLHPLEEGLTLRTQVFDNELNQYLAGRMPAVFLVESREKVRSELGVRPITHLLPDFFGQRTIQYLDFYPALLSDTTYRKEVVPEKVKTTPYGKVDLPHNDAIDRYLYLRQQQLRLQEIFQLPLPRPVPDYPKPAHAGSADKVYFMDDYVTFQHVLEFVEEVISVPLIKVLRQDDEVSLRMFNQDIDRRLHAPPLYLINNYLTFDENLVLHLELENIERIELFTRTVSMIEHFGVQGVNGALAVYTRDGQTPAPVLQNGINTVFEGYYQPRKMTLPPANNKEGRRPDFRPLEYWVSDLRTDDTGKVQVQFPVSDALSRFLIHVEGSDGRGQVGAGEVLYKVRF